MNVSLAIQVLSTFVAKMIRDVISDDNTELFYCTILLRSEAYFPQRQTIIKRQIRCWEVAMELLLCIFGNGSGPDLFGVGCTHSCAVWLSSG